MNCSTYRRSRANARLAVISLSIRRTTDAAIQQEGWRWIGGQPSAVAEALSPPADSDVFLGGSFTQVPGSARELRDTLLLSDGSDPDLYHSGLQHQGVARRFSAADDEELPPFPEALPFSPHLKKYVEAIERLPLEEMPAAAARMAMQEGASPEDLIAAVVVAGSRSCELVADHHGGPLHITAGAWAVLVAAAHLRDASPTWAKLALVQAIANANRHVQVGFKLGGTVRMPTLEAAAVVHGVEALALLSNAIRKQRPNAAERCLVAAVDAQCTPGSILSILLEEALPRNCQDDHYFLYPIFAMQTLELIGWEHATVVLRPVVRYLSTTPAAGSIDPARFSEAFRTGVADSDPTWSRILAADAARPVPDGNRGSAGPPPARMVEAVKEWAHIREAGGVWSPLGTATPPLGGLRRRAGEAGRSVALGETLSDTAAHDHDRLAVYKAVPDVLSAVLKDGLSVEAALDGLSLGAVRLYLRSEIGNPVDVHLITGIGARRYLLEQSDVASSTVAFSLLLWASGFEVTQLHSRGVEQVSYFANDSFGPGAVPGRGRALGTTTGLSDLTLLDGPIAQMLGARRTEAHAANMASLRPLVGGTSVVAINAGAEVAERLWPLIWLFVERGGTATQFFDLLFRYAAVDDFTEMHLFKLAACCQRECMLYMPVEHHWLYMCAAAKSVCNSAGAGRQVFEAAAPVLGLSTSQVF